jgi:muramoyltetrapeptide carboxypeptidase
MWNKSRDRSMYLKSRPSTPMRPSVIQKPKGLPLGSTIAIISPAAPSTEAQFNEGVAWLEGAGYQVRIMPHALKRWGYMGGSDAQRLDDFVNAMEDPSVDGILCARGGYGSGRLLPQLPWQRWRDESLPCKLLMGFSDITMLHNALYQELGWITFYSPMLTSNLLNTEQAFTRQEWLKAISPTCWESLPYALNNQDAYECLRPGTAEGILRGGNLSLIASLCGTSWQPDFTGAIVVIEDWKETYYTLDRQFTQLLQAGIFDGAAGVLFADFSKIEEEDPHPLGQHLGWLCQALPIPMGYGFTIGHGVQTLTLPLGVKGCFDASAGCVTILESPLLQA